MIAAEDSSFFDGSAVFTCALSFGESISISSDGIVSIFILLILLLLSLLLIEAATAAVVHDSSLVVTSSSFDVDREECSLSGVIIISTLLCSLMIIVFLPL